VENFPDLTLHQLGAKPHRARICVWPCVEPRFVQLNGQDASALIVSANIARRHLTKAQQAIALAMIYPEPNTTGMADPVKFLNGVDNIGSMRVMLSQARAILRHSAELAQDVLHRRRYFDDALKQAKQAEQSSKSHDAQMQQLRSKVPDIAALIDDALKQVKQAEQSIAP
jgi:hypothetical protein